MSPLDVIRDALSRVVWIRDESDPVERERALEDLELDLAGYLAAADQASFMDRSIKKVAA